MDKLPLYLRKPIFEKLFNVAEYSNLNKEEKAMYDASMKYKWDNQNALDYREEKGREEGRREGAVNIARKLKKEGMPAEQISRFTELPVEEIEKL